jgi:putative membrane protein
VIVRWLINALALYLTALLLPGITLRGAVPTLIAAAVLGIVNALIRPVLLLLTLPINLVTLGLFTFVINALMLMLTSAVVPGFAIRGFGSALLGAVVLSIISFLLSHLIH